MIEVSDNIKTLIAQDARTFTARLLIDDETEVSGTIKTMTVNKGSCGSEEFNLGVVYAPYLTATIENCTDSLDGKELLAQIGILTNNDLDNPTFSYVDVGYFTVLKPTKSSTSLSITAYGRLSVKLNDKYEGISTQTDFHTLQEIIDDIATLTGLTITTKGKLDLTGSVNDLDGWKYVEALQIIAGLCGSYVTEDNAGGIVLASYNAYNEDDTTTNTASFLTVEADECKQTPILNENDYTLDGITCEVAIGETTEEATEYVYGNGKYTYQNEYMTQALFDLMTAAIGGYTYRGAELRIGHGDLRLEPWDCISYTDGTNTYNVPCMAISIVYDGGIQVQVNAPAKTTTDDTTNFTGPLTQRVNRAESAAVIAQTEATEAKETAEAAKESVEEVSQHFVWVEGTGAFITPEICAHNTPPTLNYHKTNSLGDEVVVGGQSLTYMGIGADGDAYARIGLSDGVHTTIEESLFTIGGATTHNAFLVDYEGNILTTYEEEKLYLTEYSFDFVKVGYEGGSSVEGSLITTKPEPGVAYELDSDTSTVTGVNLNGANLTYEADYTLETIDEVMWLTLIDSETVHGAIYVNVELTTYEEEGLTTYDGEQLIMPATSSNSRLTYNYEIADAVDEIAFTFGTRLRKSKIGYLSFATGQDNIASGDYSQALGLGITTLTDGQFACGKYNIANKNDIFTIGNGSSDSDRLTAFHIDEDNNGYFPQGDFTVGNENRSGIVKIDCLNQNAQWQVQVDGAGYFRLITKEDGGTLIKAKRTGEMMSLLELWGGVHIKNSLRVGNTSVSSNRGVYTENSEHSYFAHTGDDGRFYLYDSTDWKQIFTYDHNVRGVSLQPVYSYTTSDSANINVDAYGWIRRSTSSSKRYKHNIKTLDDYHNLLDVPVVSFIYNDDYLRTDDMRYGKAIPGFIAEDIDKHYPIATERTADGKPEDWNIRMIVPPMLALIQELNNRVNKLEGKDGHTIMHTD